VELTARIAGVPVGLIMCLCGKDIEVLVSSKTANNPYHVGDKKCLVGSGLYCEKVIESQDKLLVPNALQSEAWNDNPDLKHNLVSYLGFPIRLPDGGTFGTICLLDRKENNYSADVIELVEEMHDLIESQLKLQSLLMQNAQQLEEIQHKNIQLDQANQSLKHNEEKYRFITENTSDCIWVFNFNKNKFTYASPNIQQLLGYSSEEVFALSMMDTVMPESQENIKMQLQDAARQLQENPESTPVFSNEIQQLCKNGKTIWIEYTVKCRINEKYEMETVGVSRIIADRKRKEKEIYYLSIHDYLTNIYNRAYFDKRAIEEIDRADRYREPLAMLLLDLDHFKNINDTYGHAVGDEVLTLIAATISSMLRKTDVFARYGGEEFIVMMPCTPLAGAGDVAEKIRAVIEAMEFSSAQKMTISIGVAERNTQEQLDDWYKRADQALYRAKENGRNRVDVCEK
ncbi:MAG TPA: diguanylate cyclase, partial [Negativicutes bacterium]|nr:diguanylate cyclase [Negativicutes bacterium]